MLSGFAKVEWIVISACGVAAAVAFVLFGSWLLAALAVLATLAVLLFFRDPTRRPPSAKGAVVAACDGTVSSVHEVDHHDLLEGPAVCIRVFMSVLDVHINRTPCHGAVASVVHTPGNHGNTLNPASMADNESVTTLLVHPTRGHPVAVVRQIAGLLARTIHNALSEGQVVQRGQKMGIIKLGSTTELYLPTSANVTVRVREGEKVKAGVTVLASVEPAVADVPPGVAASG